MPAWIWVTLGLLTVAMLLILVMLIRFKSAGSETERAAELFKLRREVLEAKFFDLASSLGKPRGLRWTHCDWKDEVRFARDCETGLLTAFVGVQIHFEAIEGEGMEDVEAVAYFREGSAVFHYQDGVWGTGGKALFNMGPTEAVDRLAGQFEPVTIASGSTPH